MSRYLRGFRTLTREALARLTEDESTDPDAEQETKEEQEQAIEAPIPSPRCSAPAGCIGTEGERCQAGSRPRLRRGQAAPRTAQGQTVRRDCRDGRFLPEP